MRKLGDLFPYILTQIGILDNIVGAAVAIKGCTMVFVCDMETKCNRQDVMLGKMCRAQVEKKERCKCNVRISARKEIGYRKY